MFNHILMESTATKTYAPWFVNLMNTYNTKVEALQLDPEAASEMRQLFIDKCREQYAVGNKNGIAWLKRMQAMEAAKALEAQGEATKENS